MLLLAGFLLRPHPRFADAEVVVPTMHGNVDVAAISPDGKRIVYAWDSSGQHTLTIRNIDSGEERILSQGVYSRFYGMTFTPDEQSIYFVAQPAEGPSSLYRIGVAGGAESRLLEHIDSPVSFSPDAKKISFIREDTGLSQLIIAAADGTGGKTLISRKSPELLDYPAWSPDGNAIVLTLMSPPGARLLSVDPGNATERLVTNQAWDFIRTPVWLDSGTLAASVRPTRQIGERIFTISYASGRVSDLKLRADRLVILSASADGKSLAGVIRQNGSSIWIKDGPADPVQILSPVAGTRGVAWDGNNRLLLGGQGISSVNPKGGEPAVLMSGLPIANFAVCGANRLIYSREDPLSLGLFQTTLPPGASRLLTSNGHRGRLSCSSDGEWALYADLWAPAYQVSLASSAEQLLISEPVVAPTVSGDNRWIAAYREKTSAMRNPRGIGIYSRQGGQAVKTLPLPPQEYMWTPLRWTRDNQGVGYIERQGNVSNLWIQPVDGSPRRQVTNFQGGLITDFDWAPDGRLALELSTMARDVYLVRDRSR